MSFPPPHGGPDQPAGWPATASPPSSPTPDWYGTYPPPSPVPEHARTPIYVALFIVAVLSGSALFVSGFTLGLQQSLSPGTAASDQELFDPFWEAYRKITAEYVGTYEPKALVEGAIGGMFRSLGDPYSSYMTSQQYRDSLSDISGEFEGIGATMDAVDASGQTCAPISAECPLKVVSVIAGSPAEKGGLLAGDQITAVDGRSVTGATMEETVRRVRGPRDTDVTLSIIRGGQPRDLKLTRGVIKTQDVEARLVAGRTVGYLRIVGFSGSAADSFRTHLQEQLDAGARSFVIDVRDDPGGYVDAALSIASQFIGSGPIYWEEYADGRQVPTEARSDGLATAPNIRVAVLINGGSASASEILAGALRDTGRATLVGGTTFGKGTIQQWHLLSGDSGGFRLSVAKWLTPNKTWVHGTGIAPNVAVAVPDGTPVGEDPQLDRALEVLALPPGATAGPSGSPMTTGAPPNDRSPAGSVSSSRGLRVGWQPGLRIAA